jgi:hypothetical protein
LNKLVRLSIKSGNLVVELLFELLILVLVAVIAIARSLRGRIEETFSESRDKEGAETYSIYQKILGESRRNQEIRDRQRLDYLRRIGRVNSARKAIINPSSTGTLVSSSFSKGLAGIIPGITPLEAARAIVYTTTTPVLPLPPVTYRMLIVRIPIPLPGAIGIPLLEGANATEFLKRFEDLCKEYSLSNEDRFTRLPRYYSRNVGDIIKSLRE